MLKRERDGAIVAQRIEWMRDSASRTTGLLKYNEAPKDLAAVFELPLFGILPVIHTFGMKFSIDIIFCDQHGVVRALNERVSPGRLIVPWKYLFGGIRRVIEISESQVELQCGDRLIVEET